MNELILKEMNLDYIVYLYKPEGKGTPGEIMYDLKKGEAITLSKSPEDEFGSYAYKAGKKVKECVKENNLPMKFIQAWY